MTTCNSCGQMCPYCGSDDEPTLFAGSATARGHHAARTSDPASSQQAAKTRAPGWDKLNGRALRVYYEHPEGLTYWEAEQYAAALGGLGACGWKRCSELHTDWAPPLLTKLPVMRPGRYGDEVEVWRINEVGVRLYEQMKESR